jgi:hypothetical protein
MEARVDRGESAAKRVSQEKRPCAARIPRDSGYGRTDGLPGISGQTGVIVIGCRRVPLQKVDAKRVPQAQTHGAYRRREIPDVRPLDWCGDNEQRGPATASIRAESPSPTRCENSVFAFRRAKSEERERVSLRAPQGIGNSQNGDKIRGRDAVRVAFAGAG